MARRPLMLRLIQMVQLQLGFDAGLIGLNDCFWSSLALVT